MPTFTSRWTAPDPLGDAGGDPDWYGYCLNDPVNGVDPLGLWAALVGPLLRAAPTINKVGRAALDAFMPPSGGVKDVLMEGGQRMLEHGKKNYDKNIEKIQEGRFGKDGKEILEYYNQKWK
jgi:uncharacterized protein RhaS with RHS repeats